MIRAVSALAVVLSPSLASCSLKRSVDEQALKEIAEKCELVGARLSVRGGRATIELDGRYNDEVNDGCALDELRKRGLTGTVHSDLTKIPPPTPEQSRCMQELLAKEKDLRGLEIEKRCRGK
jgi:hypothetical protein